MKTRKTSYCSKNFAYDASLLLPASGPSRGKLHERTAAAADPQSAASSSLPSNAGAGIIKSNSINPGSSSLRMEKAVMQSCWIQRLTSASPTINHEEEQLTEPSHVWTHFTKDFRSCSRRLHKTHHHMRSLSWPPNERPPRLSPFSQGKPIEPVEHYLLSRASTEENLRVPFVDVTERNNYCSRAGNLLLNQSNCSTLGSTSEAHVPRLQHRDASRTCDKSYEGKIRDEGKLQGFPTQPFQRFSKDNEKVTSALSGDFTSLVGKPSLPPDFNRENGSFQEAVSLKGSGDTPSKGKSAASKFVHRLVHVRGSSPDAVIGTSLSPAHTGASADAEKLFLSSPLVKDVNPSTPRADLSQFSDNRPCKKASLRASRATLDPEANVPAVVFGDTEKKAELGVFYKKKSDIVCDMEVKTRRNFGFLHFGGQSKELNWPTANPHVSSGLHSGVGSVRFYVDSKSIQRKTDLGASTSATNAVPFVSKHHGSRPSITDFLRSDSIVADHPEKDLATKLPQQTQGSPRKMGIQTKQTGLGHNQGGSADRISLDWSIMPRKGQEESLHLSKGEMGRTTSQTDTKDLNFQPELSHNAAMRVSMFFGNQSSKFCDDGNTSEAFSPNQAWIRRWHSSSNLIAMSGNTMSPCFDNNGDVGSDPAKLPMFSSRGEKKGINGDSRKPGRKSSKHMEGLGNFDSGATLGGCFPAYRSYASLRSRYMIPSVGGMAIVGNMASKHHPTSLQNRGSFTVWQCPGSNDFQQRSLAEHAKEIVDDNMHGVDVDDLEFLGSQMS